MSQTIYSGSLRPKRKSELQAIAKELAVSLTEGTKVEFEAAIRAALRGSQAFQRDARFADLWKSIVEGETRRSSARAKSEGARSEMGDGESEAHNSDDEVIPSPGRSLRRLGQATRQVAEEAASLASEQATAAAQQASEFAQEQYHEGAERAMEAYNNAPPAQELVLHADQHAHRMGKALARWTSESVIPSARETQRLISSSWAIIGVTLALEVLFMLSTTLPYTYKVSTETWKWAFFSISADHPWSVTLPDLAVLAQYSFVRVFLIWAFTTVLVPLTASYLVVFPKPEKHEFKSASPVTFSIVRLALDVYLHKIASGPSFDWSGSIIQRFGDVQLLSAATALAFALYENGSKSS